MPTEREVLDELRAYYSKDAGNGPRYVFAEHVKDAPGFAGSRTADFVAQDLWNSKGLHLIGHEVKVSRSDWLSELRDPTKAEAIRQFCHQWYLVVPDAKIVKDDLPAGWGLIVTGGAGTRIRKRSATCDPHQATGRSERDAFLAAFARAVGKTYRDIGLASAGASKAALNQRESDEVNIVRSLLVHGRVEHRRKLYEYLRYRTNLTQRAANRALGILWGEGQVDLVGDEIRMRRNLR